MGGHIPILLLSALLATSGARLARAQTAAPPEEVAPPTPAADEGPAPASQADPAADGEAAPAADPAEDGGNPPDAETAPEPAAAASASPQDLPPEHYAIFLHADALEAELDGEPVRALELLRKAHGLSPGEQAIAYDLARLAFEQDSPTLDEDAGGFLALEAATPDAHLLRAYLLLRRGTEAEAKVAVDSALAMRPGDEEALRLRAMIEPPKRTGARPPWAARLRLSTQIDSNVTVVPDVAQSQSGVRTVVDGVALRNLTLGKTDVTAGMVLSGGPYLNGLENFTSSMLGAFGRALHRIEDLELGANAVATQVFIGNDLKDFMRSASLGVEGTWVMKRVQAGAYAQGSYRHFASTRFNPKRGGTDRTGPTVLAGLSGQWRAGAITVDGRLGYQRENTQGPQQREQGIELVAAAKWQQDNWVAAATLAYQLRGYFDSRVDRRDQRLAPGLQGTYRLTDPFAVYAAYAFILNASSEGDFDYQRHLAQLGVEARW